MPSITKVPIFGRDSDITRVACSWSSELLGVFCIDPSMWTRQRRTGVKGNFSVSSISIFCCKARNRINQSPFSILLVNLKLAPSWQNCIFWFFTLSWNLLELLLHSSIKNSRGQNTGDRPGENFLITYPTAQSIVYQNINFLFQTNKNTEEKSKRN